MKAAILAIMIVICAESYGQSYILRGEILDDNARPLQSAAAVLLNPADSTLLYFSITGSNGVFEFRNIKKGSYLLQVSLLGFNTFHHSLTVPSETGEDLGQIALTPKVFSIDEVLISGDRIPIRIKNDTMEFDAKAFKVKSDGVAEDLIRKLPGIEVDRAGNIKALGEDVNQVLVDGKEFFGNDPKIATRNLPADAINKVQLFDRQTDESRFTGIDDGERNQTLNFVLEEGKRSGIFGDILAGAGPEARTQAAARVYRFTRSTQFAALGMYNNINQMGFSLGDYINFTGGISNLSSGDGHVMNLSENSFPVNFGRPVYGTGSNGAAGLNFSVSNKPNDRFFFSYLGNGSGRKLSEVSISENYMPDRSFRIDTEKDEIRKDTSHRFNFGVRKLINEKQNLIVNGSLSFNSASYPFNLISSSFIDDFKINGQERSLNDATSRLSGNADAAYLLKINEGRTIFKFSAKAVLNGSNTETLFSNVTEYSDPYSSDTRDQFHNLRSETGNYSGTLSLTQKITRRSFLDLSFLAGYSVEELNREQGDSENGMIPEPSLSPSFQKTERYIRPGLRWKLSTAKTNLALSVLSNIGDYGTILNTGETVSRRFLYANPGASWEFNYRSGRRLMAEYSTSVITPRASQLLPVVNNLNPLSLFYGNRDLREEYMHNARLMWWLFDQFSFTTLLTSVNMRYTTNKISYARVVDENLVQSISLINMRDDLTAGGIIDFSTAIKPLGLKINLVLDEELNRGLSVINGAENVNSSFTHRVSLILSNRKKEKWDVETGSTVNLTRSKYSLQSALNDKFHDISWFTEVRYTPGIHFNLMGSADITNYSSGSFSSSQLVPLLNAEAGYYFLKNRRGVLTIAAVDLLNRNTGIERISELNTLTERRSTILGRYFMLSFKYRLNKTGDTKEGIDIQVKRR